MKKSFKYIITEFKRQSEEVKRLININYFYLFMAGIVDIFLNIMAFDITKDIQFLVFFFSMRMFFGWSAIIIYIKTTIKFKLNLNYGYHIFIGMLLTAFGVLLFMGLSKTSLLIFISLYGAATGIYWSAHLNYLMKELNFKEKDFVSAIASFGKEIITITISAIATISFYLSEKVFEINTYTSLLVFSFLFSLFMLLKQKKMNSLYIGNHSLIETIKRVNKLKEKNIIYGYFLGRSLLQTVKMVLITFFALEVLKTALNIGIFEFMIGIVSILITSKLTNFKHSKNRMKLMLMSIILNIIAYSILFITNFSIIGYTLFSLILIIATPMYFTAQSLLDLSNKGVKPLPLGSGYKPILKIFTLTH